MEDKSTTIECSHLNNFHYEHRLMLWAKTRTGESCGPSGPYTPLHENRVICVTTMGQESQINQHTHMSHSMYIETLVV